MIPVTFSVYIMHLLMYRFERKCENGFGFYLLIKKYGQESFLQGQVKVWLLKNATNSQSSKEKSHLSNRQEF